MILYTKSIEHDFLNREWCNKLMDAGIEMSDASYYLADICGDTYLLSEHDYMVGKKEYDNLIPTYSMTDLIYKMNEYAYSEKNDVTSIWGSINFIKDAPFYIWAYYPEKLEFNYDNLPLGEYEGKNYLESIADKPLYSAAQFLIICRKADITLNKNIKNKREE